MAAGKEIKRLRGNVSAQQAATLIGVDVEKLRKWEQRDVNPKDSGDIVKVEDYFGVAIDQLGSLDNFQFVPKHVVADVTEENSSPTLKSLARSLELSAQARLIDSESRKAEADNVKRLIALLEMKMAKETDRNLLPKVGENGAVDIREKSKKNQPKG